MNTLDVDESLGERLVNRLGMLEFELAAVMKNGRICRL